VEIDPQSAIWLAAALGLAVGACLAALLRQLPRMLDDDRDKAGPRPWRGDSACHSCGGRIRGWRRLPVLGWLFGDGRCSVCRARIAARSALIALLTAVLFALCAWRFGPGYTALCAMVLVAALVALAWIDAQTGLLPDIVTLPLMWAGLLVNTLHIFASPVEAILGAAAGYLFLWTVYQGFRLATGREGMGYGDFKLLAALGAWLGLPALPALLIAASLAGVIVGMALILARRIKRNQPQPFGPYLALAGIVCLLATGLHIG
jgi:leader peptidase (prepilin peptidase)/N-methyltransferase